MVDFLQHMQMAAQNLLIEKCISHLNPGGRLIIRTDNKHLALKDKNTVFEKLSPNKFTGTASTDSSYLPDQLVKDVAVCNCIKWTVIDQGKKTSDIVFVIDKND
jgi:2-polyprenyl-3-methyl-5-hydroxy-6-metoxy-1,4-benzoquinol methylase